MLVEIAIEKSGFEITEVVSGGARGVDSLGEGWALMHGIPAKVFKPDWNKYSKAAGFLRNTSMIEYSEALIAVWDGESRGTLDTINKATKKGLKVYVERVGNSERGE